MHGTIVRSLWAVSLVFVVTMPAAPMVAAQAPAAGASAPRESQSAERDRLAKEIDTLRRAGKLDEAVAVAERALELERRAGKAKPGHMAEALARLAELQELRGNWDQALGYRKEAMAIRERVGGKDHW
jgi:tetratricopeptide (TPR) repeat protein